MLKLLVLQPNPDCGSCKRLLLNNSCETVPHVVCTKCTHPDHPHIPLHLCVWCFVGSPQSPPGHSSLQHAYKAGTNLDLVVSPIHPSWTLRQDLAMLKGLARYGFENWEDVAGKAVLLQSAAECREHFERMRVAAGEPKFGLPDMTRVDEELRAQLATVSPLAAAVGYMPLRDEFEVVHGNDAETLLADMVFDEAKDPDCGKDWHELKLRVLHNYNLKLDERQARKRFVLERGLLDFKRMQTAVAQRAGNREDARVMLKVEPLARFSSRNEHMELVQGLLRERNLRSEIRRLQEFRAMGIRTFQEAEVRAHAAKRRGAAQRQHAAPQPLAETFPRAAHEHLAPAETNLCAQLGISPLQFVAVKDALLREALRAGFVSRKRTEDLIVDVNVGNAVLDLLVQTGGVSEGIMEEMEIFDFGDLEEL